jgi:hypothetical protein
MEELFGAGRHPWLKCPMVVAELEYEHSSLGMAETGKTLITKPANLIAQSTVLLISIYGHWGGCFGP